MTLTQLRYALALDVHRHFGRAAEACFVSQPTLSMQVAKLEAHLGYPLFDRSRSPLAPTDAGEVFLRKAQRILLDVEDLEAKPSAGFMRGEIRLGVLPTVAPYLLPALLREVRVRFPDLTLSIFEVQTETALERLNRDLLDAAWIATEPQDWPYPVRTLGSETFVVYTSDASLLAEYTLLPRALVQEIPLLLLGEGHCFRDQVLSLCGDHPHRTRGLTMETGSIETLRHIVDAVGGTTIIPVSALPFLDARKQNQVRFFAPPSPSRTHRLVFGGTIRKRFILNNVAELLASILMSTNAYSLDATTVDSGA